MAESSRPDPLQRRSPAAWRLIEATPPGRLALPHCAACDHWFYPPQPFCPRCLHEPVLAAVDDGLGRVLSVVAIHRSLAPTFQARAPVAVALVQLDAGPALFALADGTLRAGQAVRVSLRRDAAAARDPGVFIATDLSTHDPC